MEGALLLFTAMNSIQLYEVHSQKSLETNICSLMEISRAQIQQEECLWKEGRSQKNIFRKMLECQ